MCVSRALGAMKMRKITWDNNLTNDNHVELFISIFSSSMHTIFFLNMAFNNIQREGLTIEK
jgi:hypothetical protein